MIDTRRSAVYHPNGFSEYEEIIITYNGTKCLELKPLVQAIYEQLYGADIRSFYVAVGRGKRGRFKHAGQ